VAIGSPVLAPTGSVNVGIGRGVVTPVASPAMRPGSLKSPAKPARSLESSFNPWVGAATDWGPGARSWLAAAAGIVLWPVAACREGGAGWEDAEEAGAWPVPSNASNGLASPDDALPACGLIARASEAPGCTGSVGTVGTENLSDGTGLEPLEQVLGHRGQKGTYEITGG
jgi:hypothetical protein